MNCTAHVRADGCDIWAPTQNQGGARLVAVDLTGLPFESVRVHTTLLGGGFGRRGEIDFVAEAVEISKAVGAPVKVAWTREDDIRHDTYRPATCSLVQAGLDGRGLPVAWRHRISGPSITARIAGPVARMIMPNWLPGPARDLAGGAVAGLARLAVDRSATEGADRLPYAVPHYRVEYLPHETGVPVGYWRSVGHSHTAFVVETFLDEVAIAGGREPYELRRQLLVRAPRHLRVLETAGRAAGWGAPPPAGRHRGVALHESFGSVVAEVAEVSVSPDGEVRVHRVVCAVDCGTVVNPDLVEAQMESGIVFGLTAALHGDITIRDGQVAQSNFHDYPMLRMHEMPLIEVHIVAERQAPQRGGRARDSSHRSGRRQCHLRRHRQAGAAAADPPGRAQERVTRRGIIGEAGDQAARRSQRRSRSQVHALVHPREEVPVEHGVFDRGDLDDVTAAVEDLALDADADWVRSPASVTLPVKSRTSILRNAGAAWGPMTMTPPKVLSFAADGTRAPGGEVDLAGGRDQAEFDDGVPHDVAVVLQGVEHRLHDQLAVRALERVGLKCAHLERGLRGPHSERAARRDGGRGQQEQRRTSRGRHGASAQNRLEW